MQVPDELALSTVRFSTGKLNNTAQIDQAVEAIQKVIAALKPEKSPAFLTAAPSEVKLTHFTHGLGCACKLRPQNLEKILTSIDGIQIRPFASCYRQDSKTS